MPRTPHAIVLSYFYPPDPQVGGVRAARIARALAAARWRVTVIASGSVRDPEMAGSHITVRRVAAWPGLRDLYLRSRNAFRAASRAPRDDRAEDRWLEQRHWAQPGVLAALRRTVRSLLVIPDERHGWIMPTLRRVLAEEAGTSGEGPALIWATSPPHSVQVVAAAAGRRLHVPVVADLRDPWFGNKLRAARSSLSDACDRRVESWVLRRAASVVTTTDALTTTLLERYPALHGRAETIRNCFAAEDFAGAEYRPTPRFTLYYAGSLYDHRTPEAVLRATAELVAQGLIDRERVQVVFQGVVDQPLAQRPATVAARLGLDGVVAHLPPAPHLQALRAMVQADLLLLLAPEQPLQVPAKAYEYLASGTDVLVCGDVGETARLLGQCPRATVVAPDDEERIRAAILDRYRKWVAGPAQRRAWSLPPDAHPFEESHFAVRVRDLAERTTARG